jgi:hypothetical protein
MTGTARDVSNLYDVFDGKTYEVRQEQVAIEEDKHFKSVLVERMWEWEG